MGSVVLILGSSVPCYWYRVAPDSCSSQPSRSMYFRMGRDWACLTGYASCGVYISAPASLVSPHEPLSAFPTALPVPGGWKPI